MVFTMDFLMLFGLAVVALVPAALRLEVGVELANKPLQDRAAPRCVGRCLGEPPQTVAWLESNRFGRKPAALL